MKRSDFYFSKIGKSWRQCIYAIQFGYCGSIQYVSAKLFHKVYDLHLYPVTEYDSCSFDFLIVVPSDFKL